MTKQDLIDSFPDFGEDQVQIVVKHLLDGTLSPDDLRGNGLNVRVRKKAEQLYEDQRQQAQAHEEEAWFKAQQSDSADQYNAYLENFPDGSHRDEARTALKKLKEKEAAKELESAYDSVDKNSIGALENFIDSHPDNPHVPDAKRRIKDLKNAALAMQDGMEDLKVRLEKVDDKEVVIINALNQGVISREQLLDEIDYDNNWLDAEAVKALVDNDSLSYADLRDCGIDEKFIKALRKELHKTTDGNLKPASRDLTSVSRKDSKGNDIPLTEVYFWGIPSSGKTCALGAILSAADSGKVTKACTLFEESQGYAYMNELPQFFKGGDTVNVFPGRTFVTNSYAMGLELTDENEVRHPLTFIDFAGELIGTMYKKFADMTLLPQEQSALDTLTKVLVSNRTGNRKIHFFVVEYGAEDRNVKNVGVPQKNVLRAAMGYVRNTNIFKNATNAIYLIVTKVDKLKLSKKEREAGVTKAAKLRKYVEGCYGTFYGALKQICQDNQINGGNLPIIGFSVGDVCFQKYFIFDPTSAEEIVRVIMQRSHGQSNGLGGKFKSFFSR